MKSLVIAAVILLTVAPAAGQVLRHAHGSGEIRDGDGRLVDDYSKQELVCALYQVWLHGALMTCMQMERMTGTKANPAFCGVDLKPKAEACRATH